jgi:riboflavin kinase / FMN adenylyltransferase
LGRSGSADSLLQIAQSAKKTVHIIPNYDEHGMRISSTWVRQALVQGDFNQAAHLLGRPYSVVGKVKYGAGIGRQLGIPTANLHVHYPCPPIGGVFVVQIIEQNGRMSEGVANWGKRQTVCGEKMVLEVHGFQLEGSLYGQKLEVRFLKKLRNEQKFSSLALLVEQIHRDIVQARAYFVQVNAISS